MTERGDARRAAATGAAELLRALGHPLRVAIIEELAISPRCVHELVDATETSQVLVSQHLRVLRAAHTVRGTRRGKEIEYSLIDPHVGHIVGDAVSHAMEELVDTDEPLDPGPEEHGADDDRWRATFAPVTLESWEQVGGPFYHGTAVALENGDMLRPGFNSNFHPGRIMNNIYFTTVIETAAWGAELAVALERGERGRIYVVEPTGAFEDDPNVTDKKFPGNPTRSFRSRHPLRVVGEVAEWTGHDPGVIEKMLASLRTMREQGRDLIED